MSSGDQLVAKAEKKAASSSGWFGGGNSKFEEAAELFVQAANAFKVSKEMEKAGRAFERAASMALKSGENHDAINNLQAAAKCFKATNPEAAVSALHQCIGLLIKAGSFRQAADREKEIAQVYATDNYNIAKARDSWVRAGDWYKQEEANATANQAYSAAADLSADLGDYPKAIELFEIVGDWSLSSALTKYSVKEYWLKACLCAMAMGDLVTCNRLLTTFAHKDVTFPSTREYKFAAQIMSTCEEGDVEAFTAAVYQYDQVMKLSNMQTSLLLVLKRELERESTSLT